MSKESDILKALEEVKTMVGKISEANGYNTTPTVRRGWLQHIYSSRSRDKPDFPIIAYRPELSSPNSSTPDNSGMIDTVTIVFDGAVSVKDSETATDDLLHLLKDLRRSLVFDPDTTTLKLSELAFGECPFDLPDAGEDYAFFSQKISFKVVENYGS